MTRVGQLIKGHYAHEQTRKFGACPREQTGCQCDNCRKGRAMLRKLRPLLVQELDQEKDHTEEADRR